MQLKKCHFNQHSKAVIASLLAGLVLLLDAMATCPDLHELIHHDADKPGHECAVTLFAYGKVDSATVEVLPVAVLALVETVPQFTFSVFAPAIQNLPAGRAPPAAVSSLV